MSDIYRISGDTLTDIADAIRLKRDIATEITPEDMPMEIGLIDGGGGGLAPIVDEMFVLPERTSAAQTIRVNLSQNIETPKANEMYAFLWEFQGVVTATPQEKNCVFRKLEVDTIHNNPLFTGAVANVCNYISTSGVISNSTVYGTLTNVSRLRDTYMELSHPAIQAQNTFPSGTWRIRGWKMADAPQL